MSWWYITAYPPSLVIARLPVKEAFSLFGLKEIQTLFGRCKLETDKRSAIKQMVILK